MDKGREGGEGSDNVGKVFLYFLKSCLRTVLACLGSFGKNKINRYMIQGQLALV